MKLPILNHSNPKELFLKLLSVIIIATMGLVLLNVMTMNKDGRKQIIDRDGGTEYTANSEMDGSATREELRLAEVLEQIKGVGKTEAMITYQEKNNAAATFSTGQSSQYSQVKGVIITAEGAGNPVVKNDIINAVATVFRIPAGNVMVFEKQ